MIYTLWKRYTPFLAPVLSSVSILLLGSEEPLGGVLIDFHGTDVIYFFQWRITLNQLLGKYSWVWSVFSLDQCFSTFLML